MKVELYCLLAGVDYEIVITSDPRKAPKGKLPYIKDGDRLIADSSDILDYLEEKNPSSLSLKLSEEDQAHSVAYRKLLEEDLYWALFYSRWVDDDGWKHIKGVFFKSMPLPLRLFVPNMIRKQCIAQIKSQGMGRHSKEEVYARGMEDIKALSQFLGKKDYFLGDKPSLLDCSAYAFIANIFAGPRNNILKAFALTQKNLVAYDMRMQGQLPKKIVC